MASATDRNPSSQIARPADGPRCYWLILGILGVWRATHLLTVIGPGTGQQFRFVGFGARLSVDARDRASLLTVPGLREIRA